MIPYERTMTITVSLSLTYYLPTHNLNPLIYLEPLIIPNLSLTVLSLSHSLYYDISNSFNI